MNQVTALILTCGMALASTGCFYQLALRTDFHQASGQPKPLLDIRVAILFEDESLPEAVEVASTCPASHYTVHARDALTAGIAAELRALGADVRLVRNRQDARGDALAIVPSLNLEEGTYREPRTQSLVLDFQHPTSGRSVAYFSHELAGTGNRPYAHCGPETIIAAFPPMYFLWPTFNRKAGEKYQRILEEDLSQALDALGQEIAAHAVLREYPRLQKKTQRLRAAAQEALRRDDRTRAFGLHTQALLSYTRVGGMPDGILDDYLRLVGEMKTLPAIPYEASRHMARGQLLFREAEDPGGFALAIKEMSSAIELAPWWAEAYFNLALVQEAAAQYELAAVNLGRYLHAAPHADDAAAVRQKLFELELRSERAQGQSPPAAASH